MKIVETGGLFHYEVRGEREAEAAQALERELDFISRDYYSNYTEDDRLDTVHKVEADYGVEICYAIG